MSLEVDHRDDNLPIPEEADKEACHFSQIPNGPLAYHALSSASPSAQDHTQHTNKRKLPWALMIALAIMTVLAIVAAAVGGSAAIRRQNDNKDLQSSLDESQLSLSQCTSAYTVSQACTNTTNSTDTTANSVFPSSNCSTIGSGQGWTSLYYGTQFTVQCNRDYAGHDILDVFVFDFADCMGACASWNSYRYERPCYGVSYVTNRTVILQSQPVSRGNCFLKGADRMQGSDREFVDSALALLSGSRTG